MSMNRLIGIGLLILFICGCTQTQRNYLTAWAIYNAYYQAKIMEGDHLNHKHRDNDLIRTNGDNWDVTLPPHVDKPIPTTGKEWQEISKEYGGVTF